MEAFFCGASHVTHMFNAMAGFHHRQPGLMAAAMDAGASVELICDGLHVHPAAVRMAHRLYGDRLDLISDSMRCAGLSDGGYTLGGQAVTVRTAGPGLVRAQIRWPVRPSLCWTACGMRWPSDIPLAGCAVRRVHSTRPRCRTG